MKGARQVAEEAPRWLLLAEFTDHPQADLAKSLLEKHGVPAHLWSDDCGGLAGGQTFIQRVRLFVPGSHLRSARDILGRDNSDA